MIELEDVKTGVSITDLGLNDFRMDLLNYVKEHGDLAKTAKRPARRRPANPELGLDPGVIFALRNRNSAMNPASTSAQHNRLHPYYLVYIDRDGEVIADHTEVKRLLDLVRTSCKGQDAADSGRSAERSIESTEDGRKMERYSDLLSEAIRSMIDVKEEKDIDSLFTGGQTTALTHTIAGLDDFELIAFLVIQDVR